MGFIYDRAELQEQQERIATARVRKWNEDHTKCDTENKNTVESTTAMTITTISGCANKLKSTEQQISPSASFVSRGTVRTKITLACMYPQVNTCANLCVHIQK